MNFPLLELQRELHAIFARLSTLGDLSVLPMKSLPRPQELPVVTVAFDVAFSSLSLVSHLEYATILEYSNLARLMYLYASLAACPHYREGWLEVQALLSESKVVWVRREPVIRSIKADRLDTAQAEGLDDSTLDVSEAHLADVWFSLIEDRYDYSAARPLLIEYARLTARVVAGMPVDQRNSRMLGRPDVFNEPTGQSALYPLLHALTACEWVNEESEPALFEILWLCSRLFTNPDDDRGWRDLISLIGELDQPLKI